MLHARGYQWAVGALALHGLQQTGLARTQAGTHSGARLDLMQGATGRREGVSDALQGRHKQT